MPKVVMGLDLGTRLAWAYGPANTRPRVGAERLRQPGQGNEVATGRLLIKLAELFRSRHKPDLVVFEKPWVAGQNHADVADLFSGFKHVTAGICGAFGVECHYVAPASIAKFVLGKGMWKKAEGGRAQKKIAAQNWAQERQLLDHEDIDDADKADACMIWYYGCHHVLKEPEEDWTMYDGGLNVAYNKAVGDGP